MGSPRGLPIHQDGKGLFLHHDDMNPNLAGFVDAHPLIHSCRCHGHKDGSKVYFPISSGMLIPTFIGIHMEGSKTGDTPKSSMSIGFSMF